MSQKKRINVVVRPGRQVTLPREICQRLGIEPGDTLVLSVDNEKLIAKPRISLALEALKEIRQAFLHVGLTEDGLYQEGLRVREEIARGSYSSST